MSAIPSERDERSEAPRGRAVRLLCGAALFVSSAGALVIEITAGRLLAPYVGMSLYSWTAIIAVILAGLSLGHWFGGYLADATRHRQGRSVALAFLGAAASTFASLLVVRYLANPLLALRLDAFTSLSLLSGLAFFAPVFFAGLVGPPLTRLALETAPRRAGRILGQMFAIGTLGAIAGTLASGFLFIAWLGSKTTIIAVAATFLVTGVAAFLVLRRPRGVGLAVAALTALTLGLVALGRWSGAFESPCTRESAFHCLRVVEVTEDAGDVSRLLVLDHLGHGVNYRDRPTVFWSSYVGLSDALVAAHLGAATDLTAFFIGGGAYTLPRAWLAGSGVTRVVVAEIDPLVTAVAQRDLWAPVGDARFEPLHGDARAVLNGLPDGERFDVIVGDAFRDISIPAHLTTLEFAGEVRRRLTPRGLYLLTVVDDAARAPFLLSMLATLRRAFPVVEVWADAQQLGAGGRVTYLVLAGRSATPRGRLRDPSEFGRLWVRWPEHRLSARLEAADPVILSDDHAPVDRLLARHLMQPLAN
jgi:spermidine synthase